MHQPGSDYISAFAADTAELSAKARQHAVIAVAAGCLALIGGAGVLMSFQPDPQPSNPARNATNANRADGTPESEEGHSMKDATFIGKWNGESYTIDISGVIENNLGEEWTLTPEYTARSYGGKKVSVSKMPRMTIPANSSSAYLITLKIPKDKLDDVSTIIPTGDLSKVSGRPSEQESAEKTAYAKEQAIEARERFLNDEKAAAEKAKQEEEAKRYAAELAALEAEYKGRDIDAEIRENEDKIAEAANGSQKENQNAGNANANAESTLESRTLNGASDAGNSNANDEEKKKKKPR